MDSRELNKIMFVTKNLTVLIAEDDETALDLYKKTVEPFFKEVKTAKDGAEAYDIYSSKDSRIDIVVTDVNMPKVSGLELIKKIRSKDHLIPIIVVSAYTDSASFVEFIDSGVSSFLPKPLRAQMLFHCAYSAAIKVDETRLIYEYQQKLEDQVYSYMQQIEALKKENMTLKYELNFDLASIDDNMVLSCELNPTKEGYFESISPLDKDEIRDAVEYMVNHQAFITNQNSLADRTRLNYIVSELHSMLCILHRYPIFGRLTNSIDALCMRLMSKKDEVTVHQTLLSDFISELSYFYNDVIQKESDNPNCFDTKIDEIVKGIVQAQ